MDLQLFLAHADDHAPVLTDGLPGSAMAEVPHAGVSMDRVTRALTRGSRVFSRSGATSARSLPEGAERTRSAPALPPDDLIEQGWGVIAPKGADGDRLLRLVEPLCRRRAEEQGAEVIVYRVDPAMDPVASARWMQHEYWDAVERREDLLPRYLLLLGDASAISWDLQQVLGGGAFVGRLAFEAAEGYEAYVDKALRWESEAPEPGASVLFFTARDGSRATHEGYTHLMQPSLTLAQTLKQKGKFRAHELIEVPYRAELLSPGQDPSSHAEEMLRASASARAGLLFSMSHGAGAPREGWESPVAQRALQGSMILGGRERLTALDLAARPFLPGGLWFFFACFSAGTPATSAYHPWLDRLHRLGRVGAAGPVLASLPQDGAAAFVAALPQAALSNPEGPLGVIGHVDLAWTWGFRDSGISRVSQGERSRAERFQGTLRALVGGHRFGVAHQALAHFSVLASVELSTMYDASARRGDLVEGDAEDEAWEARRADLWLQRHDLGAYVLLGDPAARLPIAHLPTGISRVTKGPTRAPGA